MKVLGRVVVVLIALAAVAITLLEVASTRRRKALQPRQEESTLAILERLGELETSTPPGEKDPGRESQPETGEISQQPAEEAGDKEQRSDVPRLKRAPSPDEIAGRFRPAQGVGRIITAAKVGFAKRLDGALYALNPEKCKRFAAAIAIDSADLGDFDTARTYFREALEADAPPRIHKHICVSLAWLEDDPGVAEKLLERACAGDDYDYGLYSAARLADATGSIELRDHYVARLRKVNPKMAEPFDE